MKIPTICRYCGGKIIKSTTRALYPKGSEPIYLCVNCNAYVGCYPDGSPMGKVANTVLRLKRQETHRIFDRFWREQGWTRSAAYRWLAQNLHLKEHETHIGMMEMDECEQVIRLCRKYGKHKKEAAYKRSIGIKYKTAFQTSSRSKWSPKAVIRILTNELYTGVLIQGRRTTPNYKVKKVIIKDKSEWSRIENAHEAIIPAREFQLVQRLMQEDGRRAPGSDTVYPLSGRVFCGTCGALAKRKSVSYNGKKYAYYACPTAKKTGGCEGRNISERELETAVLTTLQSEIKLILDVDRALGQVGALAWERREIMRLEAAISAQEAEIAKYRTLKTSVYEDLRDGLITQDEFLHMKQDFSERISFIEDDISGLKTELDAVRAGLVNQTGWLAQFRQYRNLAKLTRTVVVNLIDKIHIYPDKKITVTLLCKDQLTDVIAFLREQVQTQHAAEKEAG